MLLRCVPVITPLDKNDWKTTTAVSSLHFKMFAVQTQGGHNVSDQSSVSIDFVAAAMTEMWNWNVPLLMLALHKFPQINIMQQVHKQRYMLYKFASYVYVPCSTSRLPQNETEVYYLLLEIKYAYVTVRCSTSTAQTELNLQHSEH